MAKMVQLYTRKHTYAHTLKDVKENMNINKRAVETIKKPNGISKGENNIFKF